MRRTGRVTPRRRTPAAEGSTLRRPSALAPSSHVHRALWQQPATGTSITASQSLVSSSSVPSNESFARRALRTASGSRSRNPAFRRRSSTPGRARKCGIDERRTLDLDVRLLAQEDDVLVGQRTQSVGGRDDLGLVDALQLPVVAAGDLEGVLRRDRVVSFGPLAQPGEQSALRHELQRPLRVPAATTDLVVQACREQVSQARDSCRRRVAPP